MIVEMIIQEPFFFLKYRETLFRRIIAVGGRDSANRGGGFSRENSGSAIQEGLRPSIQVLFILTLNVKPINLDTLMSSSVFSVFH